MIGKPSLVQVKAMLSGLPSALKVIIKGSFSIPVTLSSLFLSKIGLSVNKRIISVYASINCITRDKCVKHTSTFKDFPEEIY